MCIGHNYIGHHFVGHNYVGHNHVGHNYVGHAYTGYTITTPAIPSSSSGRSEPLIVKKKRVTISDEVVAEFESWVPLTAESTKSQQYNRLLVIAVYQ